MDAVSQVDPARPRYRLRRGSPVSWADAIWQTAELATIGHFRPEGSKHRPATAVRVLHDEDFLYLHYLVHDRFVRVVHTDFQAPVCRDSCVEFFVQPPGAPGYCSFEINAGGALHAWYVTNPKRRCDGNFTSGRPLTADEVTEVIVSTSLPPIVEPEITTPLTWQLTCAIPFAALTAVTESPCRPGPGWRANFYKLGSNTSHPHWASWAPIGPELNFHCPDRFGELAFNQ